MASRELSDLAPETREKVERWLAACLGRDVHVLVYCTLRTAEEQADLYRIGREVPGKKVTNAPAWASWHQYGRAVDAVPLRAGKPVWKYSKNDPFWQVFAEEARNAGLEWSGDWKRFREYVHVQDTGGMSVVEAYRAMTEGTA